MTTARAITAAGGLVILVYILRLNNVAGMYVDERGREDYGERKCYGKSRRYRTIAIVERGENSNAEHRHDGNRFQRDDVSWKRGGQRGHEREGERKPGRTRWQ